MLEHENFCIEQCLDQESKPNIKCEGFLKLNPCAFGMLGYIMTIAWFGLVLFNDTWSQ